MARTKTSGVQKKDGKKKSRSADSAAEKDERLSQLGDRKARQGPKKSSKAKGQAEGSKSGKRSSKKGKKEEEEDETQVPALEQENAFWEGMVQASYRSRKIRGDWGD